MARNLHEDMVGAKNLLTNENAWLMLFEIAVSDLEVFRVTNNEESVTFDSKVYSPFPISMESMEEGGQGDLPYINVTVSNVGQVLTGYLEQTNGLLDKAVTMKLINKDVTDPTASITINLVIRETTVSETTVSFRLSHHPFFEIDMPHQRFYRGRCRWAFKSTECGWSSGGTGEDETCDKTLDGNNGCEAHLNQDRFGGFPGIPRRRI